MTSTRQLLSITLTSLLLSCPAFAQQIIFQENFDDLPLRGPVDEDSQITNAFTHRPPDDWERNASGVPGVGDQEFGVFEWEGWSFANKNFWIDVSGDEGRSQFTRGQGVVAVADPDEWNDLGDPANELGFFNTFLETPFFETSQLLAKGPRLQLKFDSSWRPQCCDDGENFDPNGNNQTATVRARFVDGSFQELLRWESAPFFDSQGRPTTTPTPFRNDFFKSANLNELLYVDLSDLLLSSTLGFKLEFGMSNAGDDWWFAMDNMQMISLTEVPGDMDIDGDVDEDDIDDFAQGIHNAADYAINHFGESPATRGSPDSDFNFDDIDWFVNILNGGGVAASRETIIAAIQAQAIPEPTSLMLAAVALSVGLTRCRSPS